MKLSFSYKISIVGLLFVILFLRLSYWQSERHAEKERYIALMQARLEEPIKPLEEFLSGNTLDWSALPYRRVNVSGDFDYDREMVLRNRSFDSEAGVHVLTPLKIAGREEYILVDRGFIPYEKAGRDVRQVFQHSITAQFTGLIKAGVSAHFLAPNDPPSGKELPWVDAWLRVDIENIQKQLPYKLLPIYLEIMSVTNPKDAENQIVKASAAKEEVLLPMLSMSTDKSKARPLRDYPLPAFDTVVPPGRHLGYVYEWAFLALLAACISVLLQRAR